ncbi:hypothetical protein D5125_06545 [Magnetovirga frankeli]|uniref:hypothetical protein n=1 Tax=Magnetovirga frankeli TaxID=947516 RepID=UPI001292E006|nr:hypothetical protein D5125_06545 [gamma proteobacterium SS-5]
MAEYNPYKAALIALVELLKEQGLESAGRIEGLNAYQALEEVLSQAEICGIPLEEIGMDGFDIDSLINPNKKAA